MKTPSLVPVAAALLGWALVGCSEQASPDPAASASGRAGKAAKVIDQADYCARVCRRATSCSLETAESLARGTPGEVALIGKLKAEQDASERACVSECKQGPLTEADAAALASAERCIEQTTCDTFALCMRGPASTNHP